MLALPLKQRQDNRRKLTGYKLTQLAQAQVRRLIPCTLRRWCGNEHTSSCYWIYPVRMMECLGNRQHHHPHAMYRNIAITGTLAQIIGAALCVGSTFQISTGCGIVCSVQRNFADSMLGYRYAWESMSGSVTNTRGSQLYQRLTSLNSARDNRLDELAVQETFLQRDALASAHFTAKQHGYYSASTPARKTGGGRGRPSG
eukprot:628766-Amphidinium_carterae.1